MPIYSRYSTHRHVRRVTGGGKSRNSYVEFPLTANLDQDTRGMSVGAGESEVVENKYSAPRLAAADTVNFSACYYLKVDAALIAAASSRCLS